MYIFFMMLICIVPRKKGHARANHVWVSLETRFDMHGGAVGGQVMRFVLRMGGLCCSKKTLASQEEQGVVWWRRASARQP